MIVNGYPVRVNPYALALCLVGKSFDEWSTAGNLAPFLAVVEAVRGDLHDNLIVHAEPDEGGTYVLYDRFGRPAYERIPESTFVKVAA